MARSGCLFGTHGHGKPDTTYPILIGADRWHDLGIIGKGITVAVAVQADPSLMPDDVKCRLMAAAHVALTRAVACLRSSPQAVRT